MSIKKNYSALSMIANYLLYGRFVLAYFFPDPFQFSILLGMSKQLDGAESKFWPHKENSYCMFVSPVKYTRIYFPHTMYNVIAYASADVS